MTKMPVPVVVFDVGCARYGGDESIRPLVEEFKPDVLIGFDPSSAIDDDEPVEWIGDTAVFRLRCAAWTYVGKVGFVEANLGGHVDEEGEQVDCADLAMLVKSYASRGHDVIVKMDCEGGEYELVPHLRATDADLGIKLALIEWHCAACGYGIWDPAAPHREGCTGDLEAWRARQAETAAMLRCETRGWNL